jgi:hypothetical protein
MNFYVRGIGDKIREVTIPGDPPGRKSQKRLQKTSGRASSPATTILKA